MKRVCVAVACVVLAAVGCSAGKPEAVESASRPPSKGQVLREALSDPENVDVQAWSGADAGDVDRGARATCEDLKTPGVPLATVWQHVVDRFGVSTTNADYFTRASARLYCPREEREAGSL